MKQFSKLITYVFALFFFHHLCAQSVVISEEQSSADASAILDVQSAMKGVLLPRVALTSVNSPDPVSSPSNGLFVFSEAGDLPDGMYYWSSADNKWIYVITSNQITDFGSGQVITQDERSQLGQVAPPGTIVAFAGNTVPDGWLLCDGSEVARADYPELFGAIDILWGAGSSTDNFVLPDLRGRFLRGRDNESGNDLEADSRTDINGVNVIGDEVGSYQGESTKLPSVGWNVAGGAHSHTASTGLEGGHSHFVAGEIFVDGSSGTNTGNYLATHAWLSGGSGDVLNYLLQPTTLGPNKYLTAEEPDHTHTVTVNESASHSHTISGGDAETRPKNAYVNYII